VVRFDSFGGLGFSFPAGETVGKSSDVLVDGATGDLVEVPRRLPKFPPLSAPSTSQRSKMRASAAIVLIPFIV